MDIQKSWTFDEGDPEELFELEEEIASGTFGTVYKSKHLKTQQFVALKILQPEDEYDAMGDFIELHILSKCDHPNIVKFYGSWKKGDETFIAIEWCGGGAVSDLYGVWGIQLSEDQISLICKETLSGLKYLHEHLFLHRDIKGANILLTESGDVKLIDFGVSAILRDAGEKRKTLMGTPYWMAPEIIVNKSKSSPYDGKVDVWSLGITVLELAERDPPLSQLNPMRALLQIPLREAPTFAEPQKWSEIFRDFLSRCLQRDPKRRASVDELLEHPFVKVKRSPSILVELIERAKQEKARKLKEESDHTDMDTDDENLDNDTLKALEANQLDFTLTGKTASDMKRIVLPQISITDELSESFSSFSHSIHPADEDFKVSISSEQEELSNGENSTSPLKMETPSDSTSSFTPIESPPHEVSSPLISTSLQENETRKLETDIQSTKLLSLSVDPKQMESHARPSARVKTNQKQRPTFNKTATKHEQELWKMKNSNSKMINQQLKQLRVQREKLDFEFERLRAKNMDLDIQTEKKYKARLSRLEEKHRTQNQKLVKFHENEIINLEKKYSDEKRQVNREGEDRERYVGKKLDDIKKDLTSDFKREDRNNLHLEQQTLKEELKMKKVNLKNLNKKDKNVAEKTLKEESQELLKQLQHDHDLRLLRFKQELKEQQFQEEITLKWMTLMDQHNQELKYSAEHYAILVKHDEEIHKLFLDYENERYRINVEYFAVRDPLSIQNLTREQELEMKHLAKQQHFEKEQQQEIINYEQRLENRDFKKARETEEKRIERTFRIFKQQNKKKLAKEELKNRVNVMKKKWETEQESAEKLFLQKQKEREAEEMTILRDYHEYQYKKTKAAQEQRMIALSKSHTLQSTKQKKEHDINLNCLDTNYWINKINVIHKHHQEMVQLMEKQYSEQLLFVFKKMEDSCSIWDTYIVEIKEMCDSQGRVEHEKKHFVDIFGILKQNSVETEEKTIKCLKETQQYELKKLKNQQNCELKHLISSMSEEVKGTLWEEESKKPFSDILPLLQVTPLSDRDEVDEEGKSKKTKPKRVKSNIGSERKHEETDTPNRSRNKSFLSQAKSKSTTPTISILAATPSKSTATATSPLSTPLQTPPGDSRSTKRKSKASVGKMRKKQTNSEKPTASSSDNGYKLETPATVPAIPEISSLGTPLAVSNPSLNSSSTGCTSPEPPKEQRVGRKKTVKKRSQSLLESRRIKKENPHAD